MARPRSERPDCVYHNNVGRSGLTGDDGLNQFTVGLEVRNLLPYNETGVDQFLHRTRAEFGIAE